MSASSSPRVSSLRIEELPSDNVSPASSASPPDFGPNFDPSSTAANPTPTMFTTLPLLHDTYFSATSIEQDRVANLVLPLLSSPNLPPLDRQQHIQFLNYGLQTLPAGMTAFDASRPWLLYWCLVGLSVLGEDVSPFRTRLISTLHPLQNPTGGFGGGHGQYSHLAPCYAAILSLALVGSDALDLVDRVSMLRWLHSVRKPDGSFSVAKGGETDVRGVYCALVIISLLRLPTDNGLLDKTSDWLAACQTYEGGFAATPNGNEAHGGYAFCALAGLAILHPPLELAKRIRLPNLVRWLSARQYAPEGGFSGRTNKLVDGCYSTWIGGCWAFVEAAIGVDLWNREGLIRYVLAATQSRWGGLRDKPGKSPDFYHSAYVLMGLSAAQWRWEYDTDDDDVVPDGETPGPLLRQWCWRGAREGMVCPETDRVLPVHPIFNIPSSIAEEARRWGDRLV